MVPENHDDPHQIRPLLQRLDHAALAGVLVDPVDLQQQLPAVHVLPAVAVRHEPHALHVAVVRRVAVVRHVVHVRRVAVVHHVVRDLRVADVRHEPHELHVADVRHEPHELLLGHALHVVREVAVRLEIPEELGLHEHVQASLLHDHDHVRDHDLPELDPLEGDR